MLSSTGGCRGRVSGRRGGGGGDKREKLLPNNCEKYKTKHLSPINPEKAKYVVVNLKTTVK